MLQRVKVDPAALQGFTLPEHLWDRAYQLLGGNAGCWKVAVSEAAADFAAHDLQHLEASWQRVFDALWVEAKGFVKRPFGVAVIPPIGGERPRWTPQQWGEVLGAIADAPEPHHAVPYTALCALVGEEAVWSLLNYGYLTLRTPSALAQDLPPAVFDNEEAVVPASFQAALAYIKTKEWKARVPSVNNSDHRSGSSRPASPTSAALKAVADEIAALQHKIDGVDKQLQQASGKAIGILAAQRVDLQAQLAYWQFKEQQLADKKRQVHEEKGLLQDKKLLLLKREGWAAALSSPPA